MWVSMPLCVEIYGSVCSYLTSLLWALVYDFFFLLSARDCIQSLACAKLKLYYGLYPWAIYVDWCLSFLSAKWG
jgi:hypothetical protein